MRLHDFIDHGKPDPGAFDTSGPRLFAALKLREDRGVLVRWDADAVVPHSDQNIFLAARRRPTLIAGRRRRSRRCAGSAAIIGHAVAMATGARRGELIALQHSDIDLINGTVLISKSLEQTAAGLRIKGAQKWKNPLL